MQVGRGLEEDKVETVLVSCVDLLPKPGKGFYQCFASEDGRQETMAMVYWKITSLED